MLHMLVDRQIGQVMGVDIMELLDGLPDSTIQQLLAILQWMPIMTCLLRQTYNISNLLGLSHCLA